MFAVPEAKEERNRMKATLIFYDRDNCEMDRAELETDSLNQFQIHSVFDIPAGCTWYELIPQDAGFTVSIIV